MGLAILAAIVGLLLLFDDEFEERGGNEDASFSEKAVGRGDSVHRGRPSRRNQRANGDSVKPKSPPGPVPAKPESKEGESENA